MTTSQTTPTPQSRTANYVTADDDIYKKPDIARLNSYYLDGDSCDQDVFAEMRSNILLAAGEHYNRRQSRFYKRIRDSRELSQEQKLRLTKNHTRRICQIYSNNIISMNPGVGFTPKDENSMHDQKVAEMHHSVWRDAVNRYVLDDKIDDWCDSFVQIGEVHLKIFYDPSQGNVAGYEPQMDPESGNPFLNEFQEMVPDEKKPVMEGEFVFEEIYGFNLLRPPENKDLRKAEWLGIRKMVSRDELARKFKGNEELSKLIVTSQDETYVIFDALKGGYKKSNKQTMIREWYFRPSMLFPEGYFYITTKEGILEEGPLPGGFFPIVSALFDKIQTTPRGRSPIKTMRPYQAEINRSASKMAEHQITLGDDKLLIQNGTKISAGASLPGVRGVNYTGAEPKILAGRTGEQYLSYMNGQISELYSVMNVSEDSERSDMKMDPYMLLFQSARQKKKFQRYIKRFEKFLIEIVHLYLRLAKIHLPDDALIMKIGKNEQVNIQEFRQLSDTCCEVNLEAQSDDIETKLGKQLVLNHALQYVGPNLKPEDVGKLLRNMPFANFDESFDDLTIDYDSSQNDMLALDRGEMPPVNQYDNHIYCIKRLTSRTRKADFKFLSPQIQQNYFAKINMHQQFEAQNQQSIQRAEQGFIPSSGYLVTCQLYVKDPADESGIKTRLARVPYQALQWLIQQLESQGQSQSQLQDMSGGAQAQLADKMAGPGGQPQPGSPQMPHPAAAPGQSIPSLVPHGPRPPMGGGPVMHQPMPQAPGQGNAPMPRPM